MLVIDEAQDMDRESFRLVLALMNINENMRVIAVGDDDQNIYGFRQSDSGYMLSLITDRNAKMYEMTENYRSGGAIVALANLFASGIRGRIKKQPIRAVKKETGNVTVYRYTGGNMIVPLVERFLDEQAEGNCCILTRTNEAAACIAGMLRRYGRPVRLIQSNDGFPLSQLAELRFFIQRLGNSPGQRVYSDENWQRARQELRETFAQSACLPLCECLLDTFDSVNRHKYCTDFKEFLQESKAEDFSERRDSQVLVSTIHKAKGMELQVRRGARTETVARYSAACRERITALAARGYKLEKACVRFVVYWKAEGDDEETAVVLPNLYFSRPAGD